MVVHFFWQVARSRDAPGVTRGCPLEAIARRPARALVVSTNQQQRETSSRGIAGTRGLFRARSSEVLRSQVQIAAGQASSTHGAGW